MDCVDLDFLENVAHMESYDEDSEDSKHPLSVVEENLFEEMQQVENELCNLNSLAIRNKGRKRQRLLGKKDKMKVQLQLVYRNMTSPKSLTPRDRKQLYYLSSKYSAVEETDMQFLYRKLCLDLDLTLENWELYF